MKSFLFTIVVMGLYVAFVQGSTNDPNVDELSRVQAKELNILSDSLSQDVALFDSHFEENVKTPFLRQGEGSAGAEEEEEPMALLLSRGIDTEGVSKEPSSVPSGSPTRIPSAHPTAKPTSRPTGKPTSHPSSTPSRRPTSQPSGKPSGQPSLQPTAQPTAPTFVPTTQPYAPTAAPTVRTTSLVNITASYTLHTPQMTTTVNNDAISALSTNPPPVEHTTLNVTIPPPPPLSVLSIDTIAFTAATAITAISQLTRVSPRFVKILTFTFNRRSLLVREEGSSPTTIGFYYIYGVDVTYQFNMINFPSDTIDSLSKRANDQILAVGSNGTFEKLLNINAMKFNATQLLNMTVTHVNTSAAAIVPPPATTDATSSRSARLTDGQIAGLVIGSVVGCAILLAIMYYLVGVKRRNTKYQPQEAARAMYYSSVALGGGPSAPPAGQVYISDTVEISLGDTGGPSKSSYQVTTGQGSVLAV